MTEEVTVTKEEYKLVKQLRNLKEKGITDNDIHQLDRNKEINKENMKKMRLETIKLNKSQIKRKEREMEYKKAQLEKKESLEKHDAFVEGKKPLFMLESDIDQINIDIAQIREVNKAAQEEYDNAEKEK